MNLVFPFTKSQIEEIAQRYPTPFHLYDEARIRGNSKKLTEAMHAAGFTDFFNYFAVKALPNPYIMRILAEEGQGLDCSSLAELELAERIGVTGDKVIFTANNTTINEYARAVQLGAVVNFDDASHVPLFLDKFGAPQAAYCRYNPGNMSFSDAEEFIMGKPSEAKYGMTKQQIFDAYRLLKDAGVTTFGLHAMLLSNDRDWRNHVRIARLLFELAIEIHTSLGIDFTFINLGGGIGVPYRDTDEFFDLIAFANGVREAYDDVKLQEAGNPRIVMENGRFMTADAGYLVTSVINRKETYKTYIGVDASMSNLMRPGMYGAFHRITIVGKEKNELSIVADVTGSLCENNDKFAVDRELPMVEIGDYLVIHTTGAHGHSMGFQYNGKLRSAELLLGDDGSVKCIRRAESLDDYFATLELDNQPDLKVKEI